nr:hypothetical protein [uncultured Rhodopila sp.]
MPSTSTIVDILKTIILTPAPALLLLASIVFFFIAVAGNISGKIEPGRNGRIASGLIGCVLLIISFYASNGQNPPGTYALSCNNTYIQGDALYSTCKGIDGRYMPTNLPDYKDCAEKGIKNVNGSLECGPG